MLLANTSMDQTTSLLDHIVLVVSALEHAHPNECWQQFATRCHELHAKRGKYILGLQCAPQICFSQDSMSKVMSVWKKGAIIYE